VDRFNHNLPSSQPLYKVAVIEEQSVGCVVRNDPKVPVQRILRTLLRMKMSGEIDDIVRLYTGESESPQQTPDKN
jgi:ABC-type amino acid transport substrate-binding protein